MRYLFAVPFAAIACPAGAQDVSAGTSGPSATEQSAPAVDGPAQDDPQPRSSDIIVNGGVVRGAVDAPQKPLITLDEEDIAAYGADSLSELVDLLAPETGSGRGRGDGRPLFLLNGQRVSSFRELRDIPPEAIKRLEVLPEEVALRYGFPPNQRVVNFILKDKFASKTVSGEYGMPTLGGYNSGDASASLFKVAGKGRLNISGKYNGTSLLTEGERGIIQDPATIPAVSTDPNPADYRSLIDQSGIYALNGNWATGLGPKGLAGSLSVNGAYTRTDTRGLSGLNTVLLTDPDGVSALRSLGDPLTSASHQDAFQGGATLNKSLGGWNLTGTFDGSYTMSNSITGRRLDASMTGPLVAAAKAGTLAIDGALPSVTDPGSDTARSRALDLNSLFTLSGSPIQAPAGRTMLTIKAGYGFSRSRSSDTRTLAGPVAFKRGDVSGGLNFALPLTSRKEHVLGAVGDITLNLSASLDHLSDFGTLFDWNVGANWNVTSKLGFQASYIIDESAPSLSQLGAPTIVTFNVPVYDFTLGRTAQVTVITGGNPGLAKERDRDIKLSANWQLPFFSRSNLIVEYFRNRSSNVTQSFPLLTSAIEAAFPGRVIRDGAGNLVSIDRSAVTFREVASSRLRWGINLSGSIGPGAPGGGGGGPGGGGPGGGGPGGGFGGGGGSFGRASNSAPSAASPRTLAAAGAGAGSGGASSVGGAGGGGGGDGGGGGPPPFAQPGQRQQQRGGRWNLGLYHTYNLTSTALIAPGVPLLDLLGGDALNAGGVARHQLTAEGGAFFKGIGLRANATWSAPVRLSANGVPNSTDLRFGSVFDVDLRLFADLGRVPGLADKSPLFKNARVMLKIDNILNSRQKVTNASGETPLAYQLDYLDPKGRVIALDFRKMF